MGRKAADPIDKIGKDLDLNKNQILALRLYKDLGKDPKKLISGKTVYQIGNNLGDVNLIRLYFKEVDHAD